MKKFSLCLTTLALMACALSSPASAKKMSDKDALVQRYYWYEELLASANSEDTIYMQTSDFINVPLNLKGLNRQQSDKVLRITVDKIHRVYGANVTINQLDIRGDYAVALMTQYLNADNKDATGKVYRMISNMVCRQVWVKTEDGWKMQRNRTLRAWVLVDGKRIYF